MKCVLRIPIILFLLFFSIKVLALEEKYNYGLYFKSYSVPGNERTSLSLDDNQPFAVNNDFTVSFQMLVRSKEPNFGSILHLQTNENQLIHFVVAPGSNNKIFPALVFNEGMFAINADIKKEKWITVSLHLNIKNNTIDFIYDDKDTTMIVPLHGIHKIKVVFGCLSAYTAEIIPMNLRNIKINQDGEDTRYWKLWRHNGSMCVDEIAGSIARSENPLWLIDDHIKWKEIYSANAKGSLNIAFNSDKAFFYFVKSDKIEIFNTNSSTWKMLSVKGGYPAMEYTDYMLYDSITSSLLSYSLDQKIISYFSFNNNSWSLKRRNEKEPSYYNHARTFNPIDSSYYFFGGYGFYRYRNDLFQLKAGSNVLEKVAYEPALDPRYSASSAIVGDELYIFGGRGNRLGRQELTAHSYYELCAINLKTHRSRIVWEKTVETDPLLIMASSMYFESSDSSFYAVSMKEGGVLLKISMKDSIWTKVSLPIHNDLVYQDCDFSLYASPMHHKLFLLIDKILNDRTHNLSIYSINTPLVSEKDILQVREISLWKEWWFYLFILMLAGVGFRVGWISLIIRKKKGNIDCRHDEDSDIVLKNESGKFENLHAESECVVEQYFDRSKSAISLLGTFNVRDKDGKDITYLFSPRLKSFLILLILYSEKNAQGILAKKIIDILWNDKDEVSARNNCNVTLRKLRVLLGSVGEVEVISDGGFLRIVWGEALFCDYHTALSCIETFKRDGLQQDRVLLNKVLEILLYGPLLSNTVADWLDDFKDSYSSLSIDLLKELLEIETRQKNNDLILRIADTMLLHDPLNEDALLAKCSVLFSEGKKGIAKSVYDRFCKEYRESLGENYKVPLSELYE